MLGLLVWSAASVTATLALVEAAIGAHRFARRARALLPLLMLALAVGLVLRVALDTPVNVTLADGAYLLAADILAFAAAAVLVAFLGVLCRDSDQLAAQAWHHLWALLVVALALIADATSRHGAIPGQPATVRELSYLVLYLSSLAWFVTKAIHLICASAAKTTSSGYRLLRVSIGTIGAVVGLAVHTVAVVSRADQLEGTALAWSATCLLFAATGAIRPLREHARRRRFMRQEIRALQPLWRTLTTAVPSVRLTPSPRTDLAFAHYRTTIECLDALRALCAYVPLELQDQLHLHRGTMASPPADVYITAVVLVAALRNKALSTSTSDRTHANLPIPKTTDRDASARWLLGLAEAMTHLSAAEEINPT